MDINTIHNTDALSGLALLPDNSVDMCVTSPPYYALRNYGTKPLLWGGDKSCEHQFSIKKICSRCDGYYGELGLEPSPGLYVQHFSIIFSEVVRVLKPTGTLWINIADTYCNKNLIGIPWMLASTIRDTLSLYLRSDIIWQKKNSMPEPVIDRPTSSHEHIFLFSKSKEYYYNAESIKTPYIKDNRHKMTRAVKRSHKYFFQHGARERKVERWPKNSKGANRRDVWSMSTSQNKELHYATYPNELVRLCIKAGCPDDGVVLDPFIGSGTTAIVAVEERRHYIGIELSADYAKMADRRIMNAQPKLPLAI